MSSYSCCTTKSQEYADLTSLSKLLKVIAENSRLQILCILHKGTHCVCDLLKHTHLSQSLISHHLKDLKDAGLVADQKKGLFVYYSLTEEGKRITHLLFSL